MPESLPTELPPEADTSVQDKQYTAVVYFHGMGAQRRYEEIARLIDSFEQFARKQHNQPLAGVPVGSLHEIKARLEPDRIEPEDRAGYVRISYDRGTPQRKGLSSQFRFYEAYWAPLAAGKSSARSVLKWLFIQFRTPVRAVFSSWRNRGRLRRAALYSLWQLDRKETTPEFSDSEYQSLLTLYGRFEEDVDPARNGKMGDFLNFIRQESRPEDQKRRIELARKWRQSYVRTEVYNMALLLTILLALVLLLTAVLGSLLRTLGTMTGRFSWLQLDVLDPLLSFYPLQFLLDLFPITLPAAPTFILLTIAGVVISRFLRDYIGDVQLWTTYEETDEKHQIRSEILQRGANLLRHILADPACGRVVVIGHSLGSAIAYEALLEIGRFNRAENHEDPYKGTLRLALIDQFITLASPIDKIHYFFESHTGRYRQYNRIVDDIRGDLGAPPFGKNRKPMIHWVNYWDRADIISSSIESASSRTAPLLMVDNVQVHHFLFGLPGASHSGYFKHRRVVSDLFSMIFHGSHSFQHPPKNDKGWPDYDAVLLGPGEPYPFFDWVGVGVALVPWLIAFTSIVAAWMPALARVTLYSAIFLFVVAGLIALVSAAFVKHRHPIG